MAKHSVMHVQEKKESTAHMREGGLDLKGDRGKNGAETEGNKWDCVRRVYESDAVRFAGSSGLISGSGGLKDGSFSPPKICRDDGNAAGAESDSPESMCRLFVSANV